jgi:hypothetical protein
MSLRKWAAEHRLTYYQRKQRARYELCELICSFYGMDPVVVLIQEGILDENGYPIEWGIGYPSGYPVGE